MTAILLAVVAAFSACTAQVVSTRKKINGPVKEVGAIDAGGGEVQYALSGWSWVEKDRRQDALAKIQAYCGEGASYKIVDEVDRKSEDVPYTEEKEADELKVLGKKYPMHTNHHIFFECLK